MSLFLYVARSAAVSGPGLRRVRLPSCEATRPRAVECGIAFRARPKRRARCLLPCVRTAHGLAVTRRARARTPGASSTNSLGPMSSARPLASRALGLTVGPCESRAMREAKPRTARPLRVAAAHYGGAQPFFGPPAPLSHSDRAAAPKNSSGIKPARPLCQAASQAPP